MHKIRSTRSFAILLVLSLSLCLFAQTALAEEVPAEETLTLETKFGGTDCMANGNMFDVIVTAHRPVIIDGFDVNVGGATGNINVYYRSGTYADALSSSDGWILAGSAAVTAEGEDARTALNIGNIQLEAGETYGIYVSTATGLYTCYYSGTDSYSDGNLTITSGVGKFSPDFTGASFSPREWSGAIHYHLVQRESDGPERREAEKAFWQQVSDCIRSAQKGGVVEIELSSFTHMPRSVMRTLLEYPGITLVLTYDGGKITIPAKSAFDLDDRSYFTLDMLKELYA